MIAEVYPILKLPRKCSYFDYDLRFDLPLAVGDLVRVPFKGREVLGIVRGLKDSSLAKKLIRVNSLAKPGYISASDIHRYEQIAECLAQSVSSLFQTIFPTKFYSGPPPFVTATGSSHIGALDIPVLERCLSEISLNKSLAISGDRDIGFALAHALRRKRSGQLLVLLPRERDAELLARYIQLGESTSLLSGKTGPQDRMRIFEAWRTGQVKTLIGTRAASLLPASELQTVLVLESGSDEHINTRRNPRFDAREAAKLLAKQHDAHFIAFDALPRLDELYDSQLMYAHSTAVGRAQAEDPIINLASSDEITNEPLFSQSLLEGIERALHSHKKVLLYLNRKGVAKRLQCGKCGHIPLCGTCGHVPAVRADDLVCGNCQTEMWIPKTCPACGSAKLALRGLGGTQLASIIKRLFPTHSLGRLEKGQVEQPNADIVIATEYFFSSYREPFAPKTFGLVADLAADISLHASNFRGAEDTARKLHRLIGFGARQDAKVIVQTWLPDVLKPMLNLPTFIANELELRKQYNLPPFTARVILSDAKLDDLTPELQALATERKDSLELSVCLPSTVYHLLQSVPDKIKLLYDGPYAQSPDSLT